jgi:transcriptional repressor NrdR
MRCPYCRHGDSRVVDSREAEDGQLIRRRRSCPQCGKRFTTVEEAVLAVVKRSGVTEPFSRTKVMSGVRKACQGRPVDDDAIALLAQRVEETIRARGVAEIPSPEVGLAILGPLRELDEVAYLRFASVYRSFDSLQDFEREIAALREAATRVADANGTDSTNEATTGGGPPGTAPRGRRGDDGAGNSAVPVAVSATRRPAASDHDSSRTTAGIRRWHEPATASGYADRAGFGSSDAVGRRTDKGEWHDGGGRHVERERARSGQGAREARGQRHGRARLDDRGRAPLRRGHLGAPRRRHDELA